MKNKPTKRPFNNAEDIITRFNNCKKIKTNIEDYDTVMSTSFIDTKDTIGSSINYSKLNNEIKEDFENIMLGLEKLKIEKKSTEDKDKPILNSLNISTFTNNSGNRSNISCCSNISTLRSNLEPNFNYSNLNTQLRNQACFKTAFNKNNQINNSIEKIKNPFVASRIKNRTLSRCDSHKSKL